MAIRIGAPQWGGWVLVSEDPGTARTEVGR